MLAKKKKKLKKKKMDYLLKIEIHLMKDLETEHSEYSEIHFLCSRTPEEYEKIKQLIETKIDVNAVRISN